MAPPKPRYKIGKYSGMERLDPAGLEEPDLDGAEVREIWFTEEREEPDFKKYMNGRIEWYKKNLGLNLSDLDIIMIGHSHIDVCWTWRYEQTREKARVTFNKACEMAEKWAKGEYSFHQSQPQLFEWIEEDYPDLFDRIKAQIKAGTFNIVGGCWVEPDCMMPSGEAFVRQRLHGMYYFKEKFGVMPDIAWMMDSFGYGWNLPQIFAKSGAKFFWTTKITWNRTTTFPFVNFLWQSPDGTKIITHESQHGDGTLRNFWLYEIGRHPIMEGKQYIGDYTRNYDDIVDFVEDDEFHKSIGYWYGKGDGGHGPTSQEVCEALELQKHGAVHIGTAKELFTKLEKWKDRFPTWNDELYLEYHRGTFTTHSRVKRNNRRLECKSISVEMLCTLVTVLLENPPGYPRELLDKTWKRIMKNQFHDALPGSSIPEAYDDLYEDWEYCDEWLDESVDRVKDGFQVSPGGITVFNPTDSAGPTRIFIPVHAVKNIKETTQLDVKRKPPRAIGRVGDGTFPLQPVGPEPAEWLEAKPAGWWTVVPLDGISLQEIKISFQDMDAIEKAFEHQIDISIEDTPCIESEITRVELDPVTGAIEKITSEMVPSKGNILKAPSNVPLAFIDDHPGDQAWNIRNTRIPEYNVLPRDYAQDDDVTIEVSAHGPVFSEITVKKQFGPQPITQKIALFRHIPVIYCEFITDWKEPTTLVKIAFHTATESQMVESDNQYCIITRKTQPETPADKARWEKIQHKFSDIQSANGEWGIAFLNNGKYAFDTLGDPGNFRLTVLKSANYPTAAAQAWVHKERAMNLKKYGTKPPQHTDMGPHRTFYGIFPHQGKTRTAKNGEPSTKVKQVADRFNFNPIIMDGICKLPGERRRLLESSNPNMLIKSVKRGKVNPSTLIIRMVEYTGNAGKTVLSIPREILEKVKGVFETDLLERVEREIPLDIDAGEIPLAFGKWEIKTVMIKY
ncbi:hypothetical protein GF325_14885 [Candidatus Bathyarchaeota archaeon]|nr:hypothetical protein [Candidatus Bathyarchaeota archaeon]